MRHLCTFSAGSSAVVVGVTLGKFREIKAREREEGTGEEEIGNGTRVINPVLPGRHLILRPTKESDKIHVLLSTIQQISLYNVLLKCSKHCYQSHNDIQPPQQPGNPDLNFVLPSPFRSGRSPSVHPRVRSSSPSFPFPSFFQSIKVRK